MTYDICNGNSTGLRVPSVRPTGYPAYRTQQPVLSRDQIRQVISNPDRTPARERFPAGLWIRFQGRRGSCAGYAGAWALARARVMAGLPFVPLSGEFLYAATNGGRDAGSPLEDGMIAMQTRGVCREDLVKHETYQWSRVSQAAKDDAVNYKGFECYRADDESELASGLALGFTGVVAVQADSRYMQIDSRGVRNSSRGKGNHAVGVQDVRLSPTGEFEFDEVGSWGKGNGQDGYAWLVWSRHLASTAAYHAFYLIRAASDPQGSNVPEVSQ